MTLLSTFRIELLEAFKALKEALTIFESALDADEALPAWFLPPEALQINAGANVRSQAYTLIQQLEYLDGQKPREILVGAGIFAASENTLQCITHLNQCKDRFKEAMLALKKANIKMNDHFLSEQFEPLLETRRSITNDSLPNLPLDTRSETVAKTLKKVGLARLHLKQCYRRIPIFFERPLKVSWTWANTKAITRITVEQAKKLLSKQGNDQTIEQQLIKLYALSPNEPLAIVQELAPHLRANVVFLNNEPGKLNEPSKLQEAPTNPERRIMVKGPIPLFYLAQKNDIFPRIRPPGLKRGKNKARRIRSDVKLDPDPFLPTIRVHRYTLCD